MKVVQQMSKLFPRRDMIQAAFLMAIWSKAESLKLVRVNRGLISSFLLVAIRHLKFTISDLAGVLAQLVERLNGIAV